MINTLAEPSTGESGAFLLAPDGVSVRVALESP